MPKLEKMEDVDEKAKEVFRRLKAEGYSYGDILAITHRLSDCAMDFNDWCHRGINGFQKDA